jgi:hypothetical protein
MIPQWVSALYPPGPAVPLAERSEHKVRRIGLDGAGWEEGRGFPDGLQRVTVNVVCGPCNNGWMSQLETEARPYIIDLLTGFGTLDADGLQVLGRWAVKTAMMIEYRHPYSVVATPPMRHSVRLGSVPDEALVMLGTRQPPGDALDATHLAFALRMDDDGRAPSSIPHNYAKTSIALGRIVLLILFATEEWLRSAALEAGRAVYADWLTPLDGCEGKAWPFGAMSPHDYAAIKDGFSLPGEEGS